jgi:hypothetical protein
VRISGALPRMGQRLPAMSRAALPFALGDSSPPIFRSGKPSAPRMPGIAQRWIGCRAMQTTVEGLVR